MDEDVDGLEMDMSGMGAACSEDEVLLTLSSSSFGGTAGCSCSVCAFMASSVCCEVVPDVFPPSMVPCSAPTMIEVSAVGSSGLPLSSLMSVIAVRGEGSSRGASFK